MDWVYTGDGTMVDDLNRIRYGLMRSKYLWDNSAGDSGDHHNSATEEEGSECSERTVISNNPDVTKEEEEFEDSDSETLKAEESDNDNNDSDEGTLVGDSSDNPDWVGLRDEECSDEALLDQPACTPEDYTLLGSDTKVFRTSSEYRFKMLRDTTVDPSWNDLLIVAIIGPGNFSYRYYWDETLDLYRPELAFTFKPLVPGVYDISCRFDKVGHVTGSPIQISVVRDYDTMVLRRPIFSVDTKLHGLPENSEPETTGAQGTAPAEDYESIRWPTCICCNPKSEEVYVVDGNTSEILVFTADGDFEFKFGKKGTGRCQFRQPQSIAYDSVHDRIFVADKLNHRVQVLNNKGEYLFNVGKKGTKGSQFNGPCAVAIRQGGMFFAVADGGNHRILLFSKAGQLIKQCPTAEVLKAESATGRFTFDTPVSIAFSQNGDLLYVVDSNLKRLLSLECVNDPEDGWKFQIAGPLIHPNHFPLSPRDIVVDFAGIILIADAGKEAIYMYRPDGAPLRCIKRIGETRLNWPIGMTVMNAGFVAILENNGTYKVA